MRGGLVLCLRAAGEPTVSLDGPVSQLRWHRGSAEEHSSGRLQIASLVDGRDGPFVELAGGRTLVTHGVPPERVESMQENPGRFVGIEWDGQTFSVIRDPMGEVPLFYRRVGDELWFSTEIQPLLGLATANPDFEALTAFAAWVDHPARTGWEGVYRVLPGEILHVDPQLRVRGVRYWSPRIVGRRSAPSYPDAVDRFRDLFSQAVARRVSPGAGVLLSGGLDSAAVAVVAALTSTPAFVSIVHPHLPEVDETKYAEAVSSLAGIPLVTREGGLKPWDPAEDIETFGMPPGMLPTGMLTDALEHLVSLGCDTALDGHDGDGVLGNTNAKLGNALLDGELLTLGQVARDHGVSLIGRETLKDFMPPSVWSWLRRQPKAFTHSDSLMPYFRGATHKRLAAEFRWRPPRSDWEHAELNALLPPNTRGFEEIELLGARFGIDVQHPFADRDLIEFLVRLPHSVKTSLTRTKPLLRDALVDLLPRSVIERPDKTDFTAVIDARVDFHACFQAIRDSGVRFPEVDYGRLFRDASKPQRNRFFWTRLTSAHVFVAGVRG